jgi:hypothetical protein
VTIQSAMEDDDEYNIEKNSVGVIAGKHMRRSDDGVRSIALSR